MRILILGGYGTFGGRLAHLLADDPRLDLVIAGRSGAAAGAFAAALPPGAARSPVVLDRNEDLAVRLREIRPDLVVDASGTFQGYGTDAYRVVGACLAEGISYLDLADGSDFVAGIGQFDEAARDRGVFLLSGVSSFPVLTAAVVRTLTDGLDRIDSISGGIAPSPYAGVGVNVIRAIASYAGKPVKLRRGSRDATGYALIETMRRTIAIPGGLPLKNTLFSLVDVPDLRALPQLWPEVGSVWMGAGPVPAILHRALIALAWLVRVHVLPSLSPFARMFHGTINVLRWGEHRGGMFVAVKGSRDGAPIEREWHLLADGDDGPLIPSMASAAIIRRCLAGSPPPAGARAATRDLELADYDVLFAGRAIATGRWESTPSTVGAPLYRRILGNAWDHLPSSIRELHTLGETMTASGIADIERGTGALSRTAAALIGFPKAGANIPVTVRFEARDGREIWRRDFAGHRFTSIQEEGNGRRAHLLVERFGPIAFALALVLDRGKLHLVVRGWRIFGIPLPLALAPRGDAFEFEENGRFRFHVDISHPLTGLIVRYRGWLLRS